jgi:hypothetical protein
VSRQANTVVSLSESKEAQFWRALKSGRVAVGELPHSLSLPARIVKEMDGYWKRMIEDPEHKERGACICFESQVTLRLDDEVIGSSAHSVKPKCRAWEHRDHLGFFHTHWYLNETEQIGFSHLDFAGVMEDGESLSIVLSGERVFALLRTQMSPEPVTVSKQKEKEFLDVFIYYIRKGLSQDEVCRNANHDLSRRLGLGFYSGSIRDPLKLEVAP